MSEVTISCPHCRRTYTMKIDPERLQRLKTRATCGRCGKTFDAASRIVAPRVDVTPPPPSQLVPTIKPPTSKTPTAPELRDEMEELAREFAEAAARFTPVGAKRPPEAEEPTTNPGVKPRSLVDASKVHSPLNDVLESVAGELDAVLATPPPATLAEIAAAAQPAPPPVVDAPPPASVAPTPSDDEDDAYDELITAVPTRTRAATVAPRSWLELADPGLASLQSPPSPGANALEQLLDEASAPSPSAS